MRVLFVWILCALSCGYAYATSVRLELQREQLVLGESFIAVFETSNLMQVTPDFSPLEENFEILNVARSQSFRIVNRQHSQENRWQVELMPRQSGVLVFPSIHFGSEQTRERALQVLPAPSPGGSGDQQALILTARFDRDFVYVQAQALLIIELMQAEGMQLQRPTLAQPKVIEGDARLQQLQGRNYQRSVRQQNYRVYEVRYAVFAQSSGTLTFAPITLEGRLGGSHRFNLRDIFNQTSGADRRRIRRQTQPLELTVRPIPPGFPAGHSWLPAQSVAFSGEWSGTQEFIVNQPLTRILRVQARGLLSEQLAPVTWTLPEHFRTYPDQPHTQDQEDDNGVIGLREDRLAVIPREAGSFILPGIELPWWNTTTDRLEYARLEPLPVQVVSAAAAAPHLEEQAQRPSPEPVGDDLLPRESVPVSAPPPGWHRPGWMFWLLLVAALSGWAGWLLTVWRWQRERAGQRARRQQQRQRIAAVRRQLRNACLRHDAQAAHTLLLQWTRLQWPAQPPPHLGAVARRWPQISDEIRQLERRLYHADASDHAWDGRVLWSALKAYTPPADEPAGALQDMPLKPLYRT